MRLGRERATDVVLALLLAAFSAWAWWTAETSIPRGMRTDPLGPAAVPILLAAAVGALAIGLGLSRLVPNRWLKPEAVGEDESFARETGGRFSWLRFGGLVALSVAYLGVAEPLGYLVASPLYAAAVLLLLGVRHWLRGGLAVAGTVLVLFLVFQFGLAIPLPAGLLGGR